MLLIGISYGFPITFLVAIAISKYINRPNVDAIPTIGPSGIFNSYVGTWRFYFHAREMLQEGYDKYKGKAFKVPQLRKWLVIVSGPQLTEEVRKAPDDELSLDEATLEGLSVEYTMGKEMLRNPYHIPVIRSQLIRSLGVRFSDIHDEVVVSFQDTIQLEGSDWASFPALDTMTHIICRTTNRLLVGLPLCRDPDWIALNIRFAIDMFKGGVIINLFPRFMAPLMAKLLTNVPNSIRRGKKHLQPMIEERQRCLDEYGSDWTDKPDDMLSWLMDRAEGEERSIEKLTLRLLAVNIAAIDTSSKSFTHALLHLAANPQFIQPLREEAETVVDKDGWSKAALGKMHLIDSFLRECFRVNTLRFTSMARKALKDFSFSDGTFIPAGITVAVASYSTHCDEDLYKDANIFDPYRFVDMRDAEGKEVRHQSVFTSPEYMAFGHGKHACPGRFFAVNELKLMLAHVVMTYDVKLDEGVRPANLTFADSNAPNPKAKVMFRKRAL